ncbi:Cationic amino acid transporter 4 [Desmophyllum pertusum]|uniref:Cationic amino acid transporter 4 n=1 Tax=Desmophyllum pertusum TaxID=174260 RepID=A0A9X0D7H1_9CNID|nr:Cationic amino acid transporter 4 [Desmophyllum pertusum]
MFGYNFVTGLTRRKTDDFIPSDSPFKRCMNVFDLTALGIGSLIDAGLYVVIGQVAHSVAGPAIILSFLIAAVASLLAGLCYAEFASRVNRAGSGYIYTYVAMGEIWAFVTGWCMITEYILSAASLASACSEYINFLCNGSVYNYFIEEFGVWNEPSLASFPDLVAFALVIIATIIICLGVKESKLVLDVTVVINLLVVTFIIFAGAYYADSSNWSTMEKFAPYGWTGILTAASTCFYCFIGFDTIPSASEEAINPTLSIPLAILLSLGVSLFVYIGVIIVLTMMVPYYQLKELAPIAEAFAARGFTASKYIVSTGALCSMLSSLLAACFATPRLIYSIAYDGLIFGCFTKINQDRKMPLRAVAVSGVLSAFLAFLLDMRQLVEMVSIMTLTTYTMVSLSVIFTRYQPNLESVANEGQLKQRTQSWLRTLLRKRKKGPSDTYQKLPQTGHDSVTTACHASPSECSNTVANVTVTIMLLSMFALCIYLKTWITSKDNIEATTIFAVALYAFVTVACLIVLQLQPQNCATFSFMVPCVPLLPALSIFINMLLLTLLQPLTYIRFAIWMTIGMFVYFLYGYHNSIEGKRPKYIDMELDIIPVGIPVTETKANLPLK